MTCTCETEYGFRVVTSPDCEEHGAECHRTWMRVTTQRFERAPDGGKRPVTTESEVWIPETETLSTDSTDNPQPVDTFQENG